MIEDLLTPLEPQPQPDLAPLVRAADLLLLLDRWVERGWLRALDKAFVGFLHELEPQGDPLVLMAAALTSHQLGHGHVCLDLFETLKEPDFALSLPPEGDLQSTAAVLPSQVLATLDGAHWCKALAASRLVALAADQSEQARQRPLVLSGKRLYLRRYWAYERRIDNALRQRLAVQEETPADLAERLGGLFGAAKATGPVDWQKLACALATRGAFSIITGGPGTGKTTTVVRLLALLQAPAVEAGKPLRIRLAAPTGKAAARLTESISLQVRSLSVDDSVREKIPSDVTTVHRLLGNRPGTRHFRHHAGNRLPLDVLVVDEASMIDLEMMANLLDALPVHARLVLLGDKDQLASVEAGAVLGDLCRDAEAGWYSPQTRRWLEAVSGEQLADSGLQEDNAGTHPLAQQVVMLRHSRRFGEGSGIGQLARWVNQQQAEEARRLLAARSHADLYGLSLKGEQDRALERLLLEGHGDGPQGYRHYLSLLRGQRPPVDTALEDPRWTAWARDVLQAFDQFQLLCAVRKGPWGVEGLNQRITAALFKARLIESDQQWYEGRPVLMTRNDYGLGLMNGDIGIALKLPEHEGAQDGRRVLRVAFPRNDGQGGVRFVLPSRLNDVETVYAMTVHKSQGSEFAHTALILPEALNPVLTKELIYTGITRAKDWFSLIEPRAGVFEEAVRRKVKRLSGLMLDLG
ncbi:Exodeoxyribonuclease V alpha chain [Pseudomonas chlororaphis subsp. aurantiaca]|uniref:RecBCD enzyme subunit RecD n=1 Tax=Pseudomonas chlororaphis subsp. aurantiaca TaxID=86192 RepID=A0AAJ0ZRE8_9PSED|nr:exodeoxyribonuclease V subunit alpha [Pseudomonas chlororaphis]AZD20088.1 Exodeoxyribonuclease V alpha chain [Pseudomonas chlororaphis subsp. aurantiaca]AZD33537.1 Exodeoxyribonuclease V alpha chain [Pseudomonas chlororaphis subsp. aurantiaca]AZD39867.1 Exodeoxyribonuclease V alpha chain [Pseudomonas chlororaphis subsp. aurantiaca]AZD77353.1 Exodeoxyribonuclease V alpha chain [Pseudomonas chlororaphis subsp. aurantiaca]MBU4636808.1 exodeoxyribonuclease V subunit alpha [Pseudomonas chlororap